MPTTTRTKTFHHVRRSPRSLRHHLTENSTLSFTTGASDTAMGVALHAETDYSSRPVEFSSRRLTAARRSYSTFVRELLAIFAVTVKMKHLIEGRPTVVFTDHKPITSSFNRSKNNINNPRQFSTIFPTRKFIDEIQHISGSTNVVTDCLSRPPTYDTSLTEASTSTVFIDTYDLPRIASLQGTSQQLSDQYQHGRQMISFGTTTLTCDKSILLRPFRSEQCGNSIFTHFHNLRHSSWKSTSRMILARFTWPNAQPTIKEWCHHCLTCQQMKITRHVHPPTRQVDEAVARFTHVLMDIVGQLNQQFAIPIPQYFHRPKHKLD